MILLPILMSADGNSRNPTKEPLQFDVAESSTSDASRPRTTCRGCAKPIVDAYYQVNGSLVCATCRAALDRPVGTRARRAARAVAFGLVASIGGSLLYFAVAAITGREFGLVAIAVGFIVGTAVRKGSGGRGGWAYQTLAIGLTYLAIVSTYIPLLAKEMQKGAVKSATRPSVAAPISMDTITISARGPGAVKQPNDSGAPAAEPMVAQAGTPVAATSSRTRFRHMTPGTLLLGIGALVLLAAVVPIIGGFSNIIGLIIIGIAVFEAWKLNRRVALRVTGPYRVGTGPAGAASIG